MLLKITGMIILVITGGLFGYSLCDDYLERMNCLEAIKKVLIRLRGEIKHNNSSVCEALENIEVDNQKIMNFIKNVIRNYRGEGQSLWEAWEKSTKSCFEKASKLNWEEIKIIKDFGRNLGITDRETQLKNIDECVRELDGCILTLKKEKKEKCKLYKTLGVLSGLFIAIVLL